MPLLLLPEDLRGYGRLAVQATLRTTDLVEAMHAGIARLPWQRRGGDRTRGITGFVYSRVRRATATVGEALDLGLSGMLPLVERLLPRGASSAGREALLAVVNGVLGDRLEADGNPLAVPMRFRKDGVALELRCEALQAAFPQAGDRVLVLAHGLCMNDLQWTVHGRGHADALAGAGGYTPVYLHYNSGRHISENGRAFAEHLERLLGNWPVPVRELAILGHSMGGLIARSARHYGAEAGHAWPRALKRLLFLGTPHHGAPLERGGNRLQALAGILPYAAPLARLGMIRSAGVTDLRHGNLLDEDWLGAERFAGHDDRRRHLPLPEGVRCHAVAATLGDGKGGVIDALLGDGLVPLDSALGRHADPARRLHFDAADIAVYPATDHFALLRRREVGARLADWLCQPPALQA